MNNEKQTDKRYGNQQSEMKELLSKESFLASILLFHRVKKILKNYLKENKILL